MRGEQKLFAFMFQKPLPARAESSLLEAPGYAKLEKIADAKPEAAVRCRFVFPIVGFRRGVPPEFSSFAGS